MTYIRDFTVLFTLAWVHCDIKTWQTKLRLRLRQGIIHTKVLIMITIWCYQFRPMNICILLLKSQSDDRTRSLIVCHSHSYTIGCLIKPALLENQSHFLPKIPIPMSCYNNTQMHYDKTHNHVYNMSSLLPQSFLGLFVSKHGFLFFNVSCV